MSSFKFLLHIFNIQQDPYDMHYNVTTVLKINSLYRQFKNIYYLVFVNEFRYIDLEYQYRKCEVIHKMMIVSYFG